jgi:hypothetical protein
MRGYLLMGTRATDGGGRKNHGKPASPPTELGAGTEQEFSSSYEHLEGDTTGVVDPDVSFEAYF